MQPGTPGCGSAAPRQAGTATRFWPKVIYVTACHVPHASRAEDFGTALSEVWGVLSCCLILSWLHRLTKESRCQLTPGTAWKWCHRGAFAHVFVPNKQLKNEAGGKRRFCSTALRGETPARFLQSRPAPRDTPLCQGLVPCPPQLLLPRDLLFSEGAQADAG